MVKSALIDYLTERGEFLEERKRYKFQEEEESLLKTAERHSQDADTFIQELIISPENPAVSTYSWAVYPGKAAVRTIDLTAAKYNYLTVPQEVMPFFHWHNSAESTISLWFLYNGEIFSGSLTRWEKNEDIDVPVCHLSLDFKLNPAIQSCFFRRHKYYVPKILFYQTERSDVYVINIALIPDAERKRYYPERDDINTRHVRKQRQPRKSAESRPKIKQLLKSAESMEVREHLLDNAERLSHEADERVQELASLPEGPALCRYSWAVYPENAVIKAIDSTAMGNNSTTVPPQIHPFFHVDDLPRAKNPIWFIYDGGVFRGRITRKRRTAQNKPPECSIYWDSSLKNKIQNCFFKRSDGYVPSIIFHRTERTDVYVLSISLFPAAALTKISSRIEKARESKRIKQSAVLNSGTNTPRKKSKSKKIKQSAVQNSGTNTPRKNSKSKSKDGVSQSVPVNAEPVSSVVEHIPDVTELISAGAEFVSGLSCISKSPLVLSSRWVVLPDMAAVYVIDTSILTQTRYDIPADVRFFFRAENPVIGQKIEVNVRYEDVLFPCSIEVLSQGQDSTVSKTMFHFDGRLGRKISRFHRTKAGFGVPVFTLVSERTVNEYSLYLHLISDDYLSFLNQRFYPVPEVSGDFSALKSHSRFAKKYKLETSWFDSGVSAGNWLMIPDTAAVTDVNAAVREAGRFISVPASILGFFASDSFHGNLTVVFRRVTYVCYLEVPRGFSAADGVKDSDTGLDVSESMKDGKIVFPYELFTAIRMVCWDIEQKRGYLYPGLNLPVLVLEKTDDDGVYLISVLRAPLPVKRFADAYRIGKPIYSSLKKTESVILERCNLLMMHSEADEIYKILLDDGSK